MTITVSLTNIPERIKFVKVIIDCLLRQSTLPDKINLFIPKLCKKNLKPYEIPKVKIN